MKKHFGRQKSVFSLNSFGALPTNSGNGTNEATLSDIIELLASELAETEGTNPETGEEVMMREMDPLRLISGQCHYVNPETKLVEYGRPPYICYNNNPLYFRFQPFAPWLKNEFDAIDLDGDGDVDPFDYPYYFEGSAFGSLSPNKFIFAAPVGPWAQDIYYHNLLDTNQQKIPFGKNIGSYAHRVQLRYGGTCQKQKWSWEFTGTEEMPQKSAGSDVHDPLCSAPNPSNFKKITMHEWQTLVKTGGYKWSGEPGNQEIDYYFSPLVPRKQQIFKDHYFVMETPFTDKELEELDLFAGPLYASAESNYISRYKDYESAINYVQDTPYTKTNNQSVEKILPHYYSFVNQVLKTTNIYTLTGGVKNLGQKMSFIFTNPGAANLTLAGSIDQVDALNALYDPPEELGYKVYPGIAHDPQNKQDLSSRYFNELWAPDYKKMINDQSEDGAMLLQHLGFQYENILIPAENLKILDAFNDKENLFPFNITIAFNTSKTNKVANMINQSKLSSPFMKKIAQLNTINQDGETLDAAYTFEGTEPSPFEQPAGDSNIFPITTAEKKAKWTSTKMAISEEDVESLSLMQGAKKLTNIGAAPNLQGQMKTLSIRRFLDAYINSGHKMFNPMLSNHSVIAEGSNPSGQEPNASNKWISSLMTYLFTQKFETMVKQHTRTYEEILAGKPCYNETLVYRIAKLARRAKTDEPFEEIQNIYLPNTSKLNIAKYIDTQIKYGQGVVYKYIVYAYQVVFGNSYLYEWDFQPDYEVGGTVYKEQLSGLHENEDGSMTANFNVHSWPDPILVEVPFWESEEIYMLDKPPIYPDVNIIPFRAVNNRLLFNFNHGQGRHKAVPITILPDDQIIFDKMKKAQGVYNVTDEIEFATEDQASIESYEIFRSLKHPMNYSDFGKPRQIIVNSTSYLEDLVPNTKYWYTFRAKDAHGHVSNPSPIYEVELYDDGGAVRPIIKTVPLKEPEVKFKTKTGKKFMEVRLSARQLQSLEYDMPIDKTLDPIFVEKDETPKKFKIRLTSRKSNKKIDINLRFKKKENVKNVEELANIQGLVDFYEKGDFDPSEEKLYNLLAKAYKN